jgi:hypothetical protein
MKPSFRFRPNVQCLEDRTCPTVSHLFYNGALFLSGTPSGDLDITGQGGNSFLVQDGGNSVGTFALSGNLSISLANHPGAISIDLHNSTIGGNVLINEGTGLTSAFGPTDIFDSTATAALSGGQIMGGLSILNGNGAERLDLGGQFTGTLANLPVTVRGNVSVAMKASANAGDTMVVVDGTQVRGSFTATNVDTLTIGRQGAVATNFVTIVGGVSVTTSGVGPGTTVILSGHFGSNVSVNAAAATAGSNSFTLEPPNPGVNTTVAGTLNVTLGSAAVADQFTVLHGAGTNTSTVSGNTTFSCINGVSSANNTFLIAGVFLQSLNLNLGNYNDNLDVTNNTTVFGNANISAGNGVTNFANPGGSAAHFSANVNGNLTFNFGSGDNNGGAAMVVDGNVGGTLKWRSGNGSDYLKVGSGGNLSYLVDVAFGNADDTFEMDLGAGGILSGKVDGGGRITANTFITTSGTTAPTFVMVNFP